MKNDDGIRSAEAVVSGRVQGVWFRAFTRGVAEKLGLTGFVKNLADGRVHLVAVGPAAKVSALLDEVKQGPPGSRVDDVSVSDYAGDETFSGFSVR
ncbi:MAG: acylphosphatase [Leptospirillia bacterium]